MYIDENNECKMILNFTEINMVTCSFLPFAVNITLNLSNVLPSSTMVHWRKIVIKKPSAFRVTVTNKIRPVSNKFLVGIQSFCKVH